MSKPKWEFRDEKIYNDLGHSELAKRWHVLLERDERLDFPAVPVAFDPEELRMDLEASEVHAHEMFELSEFNGLLYDKAMTALRKIKAEVETAIEKKGGLSLTGLKSLIDELEKGIK